MASSKLSLMISSKAGLKALKRVPIELSFQQQCVMLPTSRVIILCIKEGISAKSPSGMAQLPTWKQGKTQIPKWGHHVSAITKLCASNCGGLCQHYFQFELQYTHSYHQLSNTDFISFLRVNCASAGAYEDTLFIAPIKSWGRCTLYYVINLGRKRGLWILFKTQLQSVKEPIFCCQCKWVLTKMLFC